MFIYLLLLPMVVHAQAAGLDGRWRQGCAGGYRREELFRGGLAAYSERNFWDEGCRSPAVEAVSRGWIALGGLVSAPREARAIDFTFEAVSVRPLDPRAAAAYRARRVCGIRDWAEGEERDVTGLSCDFAGLGSVIRVPARGERRFGVVRAEGGLLYLGRLSPERDGTSPARRPRELDPSPYREVAGEAR